MTLTAQAAADAVNPAVLDPANLDGHRLEELSAYLDADRTPTVFSIEASPGCQRALAALARLGEVTRHVLEAQAAAEPVLASWVSAVMDRVAREASAAQDIPIATASPAGRLQLTARALRGVVRAAGDAVPDVIVGACHLDGDVTNAGEPIVVTVDISVAWGTNVHDAADRVRTEIRRAVSADTGLTVAAIHVNVQDVHVA